MTKLNKLDMYEHGLTGPTNDHQASVVLGNALMAKLPTDAVLTATKFAFLKAVESNQDSAMLALAKQVYATLNQCAEEYFAQPEFSSYDDDIIKRCKIVQTTLTNFNEWSQGVYHLTQGHFRTQDYLLKLQGDAYDITERTKKSEAGLAFLCIAFRGWDACFNESLLYFSDANKSEIKKITRPDTHVTNKILEIFREQIGRLVYSYPFNTEIFFSWINKSYIPHQFSEILREERNKLCGYAGFKNEESDHSSVVKHFFSTHRSPSAFSALQRAVTEIRIFDTRVSELCNDIKKIWSPWTQQSESYPVTYDFDDYMTNVVISISAHIANDSLVTQTLEKIHSWSHPYPRNINVMFKIISSEKNVCIYSSNNITVPWSHDQAHTEGGVR